MAAEFSPVEQRILKVLADGLSHTKAELMECLYDDEHADGNTIHVHLTGLRKKLLKKSHTIICDRQGSDHPTWRHVVLVKPGSAE